jgi:tetratricopeptide (TPR) repeat protein
MALVGYWLIKSDFFTRLLAGWHASTIQEKLAEDDLEGALAACEKAIAILPDDAWLYAKRAQIQQERGEWSAALEDLNRVQELNPHFPQGLLQRSFVHLQLKDHDAAIADAREAREWWGSDDPRGLNHLAYTLAVAGRELDKALSDAERAVKLSQDKRARRGDPPASSGEADEGEGATDAVADGEAADADENLSSYLDTRGFVLLRLGQQAQGDEAKARYAKALADFDEAIRLFSRWKKAALEALKAKDSPGLAYTERRINASLGLMHHHRSQAHAALGQTEQAQADKDFAVRLGYDPAKHGL